MPKYKNRCIKYLNVIKSKQTNNEKYTSSLEHYKDWLMMHLGTIEQEEPMELYLRELTETIKSRMNRK